MSSFYDDASLVVIPSGYKTSKVYAEKPTDGSGDLTFTRTGDTATRVNSAGLIEKVRTNLVLQSQTFDNASWTKDGATVTANSTTAPDGTTTADKVLETATTAVHNIYQVPTLSSNIYSISFFVKKAERFKVAIADRNSGGYVAFNLNTGAIIESLIFSGKIQSLASDWYRVTITSASALSTLNPQVFILPDSYTTGVPALITYAGSATSGLFVWGAQLETSDFGPTDYIPTTTAAVSFGPVANVPRLDYLGSTCGKLLLEPQRTNFLQYSEQLDNAYWTKTNVTITANSVTSPDGYANADVIIPNTTNANHGPARNVSGLTSGATYSCSIYAKAQGYSKFRILAGAGTGSGSYEFDLTAGTAEAGATITSVGNGWYRCVAPLIPNSSLLQYLIFISNGSAYSYAGNGTSGIAFWGAQLELGAYATSLIPTLAASATRGAEKVAKTGITSLIGQTEGTIYFEINKTARTDSEYRFNLSDGSSDNWIFLGIEASNVPRFYVRAAASTGVDFSGSALSSGTHKVAAAYKQNDFVLYVDGMQVGSDTSGNVGATSQLHFGGNYIDQAAETDSRTAQALLFKTRLSNASLAELTTL